MCESFRRKLKVDLPITTMSKLLDKKLKITAVVLAYWFVSISTVFLNKKLFSSNTFNAPLTITWFQCLVTIILCRLSNRVLNNRLIKCTNVWDRRISKKIIPVSLVFTLMISSNNLSLKYVSVSFYYIGRCLTTVFNVILTYKVLHKTISINALFFCFVIVFGFVLGIDQESVAGTLSVTGLSFGVIGSFLISLYSILIKKALKYVDDDTWTLTYFNNCYSIILFVPLILLSDETTEIFKYWRYFDWHFFVLILISGVFGFSIGFLTSLQIQVTSPLTNNVSGTAKACLQTVLSTYYYNESKSLLWWTSNFVVLFGSGGYARVKQLEMDQQFKSIQPNEETDITVIVK